MAAECSNRRCDFFLLEEPAWCPACGKSQRVWAAVTDGASRPGGLLDERYEHAVAASAEHLQRWMQLVRTRAQETLDDAKTARLDEAIEAESTAAEAWVETRNGFAFAYIENAVERLFHLANTAARVDAGQWQVLATEAEATLRRWVDTLCMDHKDAAWAHRQLEVFKRFAAERDADDDVGPNADLASLPVPPLRSRVDLDLSDFGRD